MEARPGGPTAKREPSPEGLGLNPEDDLSAVGATLTRALSDRVIRSEAEGRTPTVNCGPNPFLVNSALVDS